MNMRNRLLLVLTAASMLGACSIWATQEEQDAYRQAHPQAAHQAAASAPAPIPVAPTVAPPPPAAPTTVAANVVAPAPSAPARDANNGEVIVPGVVHRQVQPPNGDPRSTQERMADIRSWDHCVMHAQNVQSDPLRPITDTPEDICRQRLGMNDRTSVPDSRKPHP